ncbi:MAG: tRNA (adenosine(37)-N6)-threonylcarbamoyltransferase complex dimerization subunit type 1 TsaB [Candidatus Arsenophonus melophagi]|nr:tRNA (adenosine(37)-N6)-threonylcarbamoyltransferase complex dimerization subunit type 1 TsaB [Candidatus Arsenophonus melophagi]
MNTHILAIDTATEACSVALWRDGNIFRKFIISPRERTRKILPIVEQCLAKAHLNLQDISVVAFSRGPGSFTGVRISVGIAQGLALGVNLPIIGISSLLTMAQGAYRKSGVRKILVALDARMGEIYSACYELKNDGYWHGEETEAVLKPEQFLVKINRLSGKWAVAGKGWLAYPVLGMTNLNLLESGIYLPDAQDMLLIALQAWKQGKTVRVEEAQPVYLRNENIWQKLPGR